MANSAREALKALLLEGRYISHAAKSKDLYIYGPSGALLRRKLQNAWWQWMVTNQNNTYPLELGSADEHELNGIIKDNFASVSCMTGKHLPFSVAYTSPVNNINQEKPVNFLQLRVKNSFILHHIMFFHEKKFKGFPKELDDMIRYRLKWWKQFVNSPSKYTATEIKKDKNHLSASVLYDLYGTPVQVEKISYVGNEEFSELSQSMDDNFSCVNKQGKEVLPSVVECKADLEEGMLSILNDAGEISSDQINTENSRYQKLQLHPCLTPYIINVTCSAPRTMQMKEILNYICKEVRSIGIDTLYFDDDSVTLEEQVHRNDKMGVLFTLILTEDSLQTGILQIRHRDTTVFGDVHITHIKELMKTSLDPANIP